MKKPRVKTRLTIVTDQETGEIIAENVPYNEQSKRTISDKQREGYRKYLEQQNDKRHFSFMDMEKSKEVNQKLSTVHLGYLLNLQCYIDFETGLLKETNGMVMTKKVDIQRTLQIPQSTNKRLCKTLEDDGILEWVDGQCRINPAYHFKGQMQDKKVIKLFTTTLKQLCAVLKPAELGFLYKLLPYVHYNTNMICINPHEVDPQKVEYLNQKAISHITGIHEKKIPALLRGLRKGGVIAETTLEDKRHTFITLNPYIFYRKSGQPDSTLRSMFAATPYTPKK